MLSPPSSFLSPFAECIVLATIRGCCMTYRRSYTMTPCKTTKNFIGSSSGTNMDTDTGEANGSVGGNDFWTRQRWLASAVEKRLQSLGTHRTGVSSSMREVGSDSMLLFAHMLAHSAVIKLGQMAQQRVAAAASSAASSRAVEHLHAAATFKRKASSAANEVVLLARQMRSFGCFKVHPFLPDLLRCAATYLTSRSGGNSSLCRVGGGAQQLLRVLGDMQGMNSLARVICSAV